METKTTKTWTRARSGDGKSPMPPGSLHAAVSRPRRPRLRPRRRRDRACRACMTRRPWQRIDATREAAARPDPSRLLEAVGRVERSQQRLERPRRLATTAPARNEVDEKAGRGPKGARYRPGGPRCFEAWCTSSRSPSRSTTPARESHLRGDAGVCVGGGVRGPGHGDASFHAERSKLWRGGAGAEACLVEARWEIPWACLPRYVAREPYGSTTRSKSRHDFSTSSVDE